MAVNDWSPVHISCDESAIQILTSQIRNKKFLDINTNHKGNWLDKFERFFCRSNVCSKNRSCDIKILIQIRRKSEPGLRIFLFPLDWIASKWVHHLITVYSQDLQVPICTPWWWEAITINQGHKCHGSLYDIKNWRQTCQ